jgi:adenosylcobinamide-phosphate synthase
MSVLIAFLSLAFEAKFGYPDRLYRWVGHPVTRIGRLISCLDLALNRATDSDRTRRLYGVAALVVIVAVPALVAYALERLLLLNALGLFVVVALGTTLLAQKSLADHVEAVAKALDTGGLKAGREAVSRIVGRDPEQLDRAAVARAAIESLAENFSDGIVAPAFWLGAAGLPGIALYKAVNTADSMIGHMSDRHRAFGWASARFDDLANLVPARLSGVLTALAAPIAGGGIGTALSVMARDARGHASPNAGWPEAAMAGALGIALLGPTVYDGETDDKPWLNFGGRHALAAADVTRSLRVFRLACGLHALAYGAIAAVALALSV